MRVGKIFVALASFFSIFFLSASAFASELAPSAKPLIVPPGDNIFFGQSHYYTVVFRNNGEAVVYSKFVLVNPEESSLSTFSFEVPKVVPSDLVIFQQKLRGYCLRYDPVDSVKCIEEQEPDYRNYYYGQGAQYQKIQYEKIGNTYKFDLPDPVNPNTTGALIIAYIAKGYAKEELGAFKFDFETLKVDSRIESVRVAVDVDSDLYLKGKKASVNYTESTVASIAEFESSVGVVDRVASQIGSYGALVKESKGLAPSESFSVRGEYSDSLFKLYLRSIGLSVAIIAAIIFVLVLFKRVFARIGDWISSYGDSKANSYGFLGILNISIGLLSAFLALGLTVVVVFIQRSNFISYEPFITLLVVVIFVLLYFLALLAPAIASAISRGWRSLLTVLLWETIWLFVFVVLYFLLFKSGLDYSRYPKIVPQESVIK
ncbi:MAG: hypothetical protein HYU80_01205 [Candidatus Blackburnbacteria bacterium]|nr:hypothetical protein [Candidatus Blackburnbacteria bacterium]